MTVVLRETAMYPQSTVKFADADVANITGTPKEAAATGERGGKSQHTIEQEREEERRPNRK